MVPDDYIRKQTLVGGGATITPELKEYESRYSDRRELKNLEYQLFHDIIDDLQKISLVIKTHLLCQL
jgi:DNA mismatch repair protein MutS